MSSRTGRPPLTERRKAATRLDIARAAVGLFTAKGVAATNADEIAAAAGLSVRTLWRYFPSKESCVTPLLTTGAEGLARVLRAWPPGQGVDVLLERIRGLRGAVTDAATLVALVRLTRANPELRAVWLQTLDESVHTFATALADRSGASADDLPIQVRAAMINTALRVAVEHYAWHMADRDTDGSMLIDAVRTALETAAEGL